MQRYCKRQKRIPSWGWHSSAVPISLMRLTHLCLDSFTSAQQLTALACVEVSCVTLGLIMEAVDLLRLWWMQVSLGSLATPYWIRCFSDRIISQSWCFSEQTPQIYSLWYNSRLQHKPELIHREVHHPTCCLSTHLRLSLSLPPLFSLSLLSLFLLLPVYLLWLPSGCSYFPIDFLFVRKTHRTYSLNDW